MTTLTRAIEVLREVRAWMEPMGTDVPDELTRLARKVEDVLRQHDQWHRGENTLRWTHYGDSLYVQVVHQAPGRVKWEVRPLERPQPSTKVLARGETETETSAKMAALEAAHRCKRNP